MKKFLVLIMTFIPLLVAAQVQKGYVKTQGTPNKKGAPLENVSVKAQGNANATKSNTDGTFEMSVAEVMDGDGYYIASVFKSGFELTDKDFCTKRQIFSSKERVEIVMISRAELAQIQSDMEDSIRRKAEEAYIEKMNFLEQQLKNNNIALAEYQERVAKLEKEQESMEQLISDMVERYSRTDFDLLDSLNQQITQCIMEGNLLKADSMINSKGNIQQRIRQLKEDEAKTAAFSDENKKRAEQEALLKQQNQKAKEELAEDLYNKYTIAMAEYRMDTALYYIKERALLDTTNYDYLFDCAYFLAEQNKMYEAVGFYEMALANRRNLLNEAENEGYIGIRFYMKEDTLLITEAIENGPAAKVGIKAGDRIIYINNRLIAGIGIDNNTVFSWLRGKKETNVNIGILRQNAPKILYFDIIREHIVSYDDNLLTNIADILNSLGNLHANLGKYELAEQEYSECLTIYRTLAAKNSDAYNSGLANILLNFGLLNSNLGKYEPAEQEYSECLTIYRALAAKNSDAYNPGLAMILNNLGVLHSDLGKYEFAEQEYSECLTIYRALAAKNPDAYNSGLTNILNNLGLLHKNIGEYELAEHEYSECLSLRRALAAKNPDAYNPDLANILNLLGILHSKIGQYELAEQEYLECLTICRALAAKNPDAYNPKLAVILITLGSLHSDLGKYELAEQEYSECLTIRRALAAKYPDAYNPGLAMILNNLGVLHSDLGKYELTEQEYSECLTIRRALAAKYPDAYNSDMTQILNNLGVLHSDLGKYELAEQEFSECLTIYRSLVAKNPDAYNPGLTMIINQLSYNYAYQQNYPKALQSINEAIALFPKEPNYLDTKGEILMMQNNKEEAMKVYKDILKLNPNFFTDYEKENGEPTAFYKMLFGEDKKE